MSPSEVSVDICADRHANPAAVDCAISALASESRRTILAYVAESSDETTSLDELVECLVSRLDQVDASVRHQIRLRLHHVELPRLSAESLVDYDPQTTTVRDRESVGVARNGESTRLIVDVNGTM